MVALTSPAERQSVALAALVLRVLAESTGADGLGAGVPGAKWRDAVESTGACGRSTFYEQVQALLRAGLVEATEGRYPAYSLTARSRAELVGG